MAKRSQGRLPALILLLVLFLGAALLFLVSRKNRETGPSADAFGGQTPEQLAAQLDKLEARENEVDQTIWAKELQAQKCGQLIESLWDLINLSSNKLSAVASFPIGELLPAKYESSKIVPPGIAWRQPAGSDPVWSAEMWRQFLEKSQRDGWQLGQVEFRHNRFELDAAGQPYRSYFYFAAHFTNDQHVERTIIDGDIIIDWQNGQTSNQPPAIKRVDATHLAIKTRRDPPAFQPLISEQVLPPEKSYFIDPLILYDLNGDGLSEIILAAKNLVFRRQPNGQFESETFCRHSPGLIFTGIIADFDRDGAADFLCAKFEGLLLFRGSTHGTFDEPGRLVWAASPRLKYGQALTCGDIDHDGDLDVWLGQYKVPYERGQMPSPYYDANDGHPSYLLLNDGNGNFSDGTLASGLGQKRSRRCYTSSFVDLDKDGDLDLLVVSDFAGIDLYANDGRGHFTDVTRDWMLESHSFGMAHALADFDVDGRLDLLMIGMNSPTAERLDHLGLVRPNGAADGQMRAAMTFGNRLYLSRSGTPMFHQTSLNNTIARTGWSWGCAASDFDNDGFPDLYVANGHETKGLVRDYESEFWLHDIYVGNSKENLVVSAYFGSKSARTRGRGFSYGGYERNRLLLNQHGESFLEVGHLFGVALAQDSRNVVADDLDGDGRSDLLVTTFEAWPQIKQTIQVFKNNLEAGGNWIGFRFREKAGAPSPVGAAVTVHYAGRTATRHIVTGDSYRSQHANTLHFGLGQVAQVDSAEIKWLDGSSLLLRQPELNQYHQVAPQDVNRKPR